RLVRDANRSGSGRVTTVEDKRAAPDKFTGRLDVEALAHGECRFFRFPTGIAACRPEDELTRVIDIVDLCAGDLGKQEHFAELSGLRHQAAQERAAGGTQYLQFALQNPSHPALTPHACIENHSPLTVRRIASRHW